MKFVQLNRTFVKAPEEESESHFEAMFDNELLREIGQFWPDVLQRRFALILGTAGVGKTTELEQKAKALAAEGKPAFFVRIEDIAKDGLEGSLLPDDKARFEAWLRSGDQAVFFLDSVDEAKIATYRDFSRALNKFVIAVNSVAARVNVVLSCRPSDWMHITDLDMVKAAFAPLAKVSRAGGTPSGPKLISDADTAENIDVEDEASGVDGEIDLVIYQLRPLDRAQILTMAKAFGLSATDADAFVSALEAKENLFIAATPRDMKWLTAYWKVHKKIGHLSEMMAESVGQKLLEENVTRALKDIMPSDKSRSGTERVAGANMLCREPNIKIFDPELTANPVKGLKVEELLSDYPLELLLNLLRRPIYNEQLAGRVRIEPKQTRTFLAGAWLLQLIRDGAPRSKIRDLLTGSVYGKAKPIASMVEVAAWVAHQDSAIRAHLIRVVPEAILFMGDAAVIPVAERIEAIRNFVQIYTGPHRFEWIVNDVDYARASDPAIDTAVNELLNASDTSFDATKLLLRFAAVGKLPKSATTALRLALKATANESIRVWAIDAVAQAGTDSQRARLRSALLDGTIKGDRLMERASRELLPHTLSLADLEAIIDLFAVESPDAVGGPPHTVAYYWTANCPVAQLNDFLAILVRKVTTPPLTGQDGFPAFLSQKYAWLIDAVNKCARRVVEAGVANTEPTAMVLNQALFLVEKAKDQRGFHVYSASELQDALRRHPDARRSFVAYKILTSTRQRHFLSGRTFSRPVIGDDEWLLAKAESATDLAKRARLVQGAVEVWAMTTRRPEMKDRLKAAVTAANLTDDQKRDARRVLDPPAAETDHEWEDEQRERKAAETKVRAENKAKMTEGLEQIRDGSNYSALSYLVKEMRQAPSASNSNWGQTNIAHIERLYDKPIADALRAGLSVSWRRFTPPLRSELANRNSIENGVLTGLTALALDFRDGFDFSTLNAEDAAIATHYALREINQFPRWFATVAATHPGVVGPILIHEIKAQLAAPADQRSEIISLREIRRNDTLSKLVGTALVEELSNLPTLQSQALTEVLDVIDAAGVTDPNRAKNAAKKAKAAWTNDQSTALVWLQEWLKSAPAAALEFLEAKLSATPTGATGIVKRFLLQIDDDIKNAQTGAYLRNVDLLMRLIPLAYKHVPLSSDPKHKDFVVYDHTEDDEAREVRGRLAGILETMDGMEAHNAIRAMISHPDVAEIRTAFERAIDRHASRAVEFKAWKVEDVRNMATFYSRDPQNPGELFRLVCERLDDIRDNIETDDFGDKGIVDAGKDETRLQRYFAGRVDRESRSRFSVVREPEVANHKKPDFQVHHARAGMTTVEIKPLDQDRHSFPYLVKTLSTQLVDQYMKSKKSKHGVLLLCLLESRTWTINGKKNVDFQGLLEALRKEAAGIQAANANVEGLAVIGVDMSAWKPSKKVKKKKTKAPNKTALRSAIKAARGKVVPKRAKKAQGKARRVA